MEVTSRKRIERARYVAAHYELLQGLAVLPLLTVLVALMVGVSDLTGGFPGWVVAGLLLVGLPGSFALGFAISRSYQRRYGQVRQVDTASRNRRFGLTLVGISTLVALVHAVDLPVPISPEGLIWSGAALAAARFQRPLAAPFLAVGTVGAVASLVPLGLLTGTDHPLSDPEILIISCYGAAMLVAVGSHLVLRAALAPVPRSEP
jgi:hypothetical protein